MKAIVVQDNKTAAVGTKDIPEPEKDEVLVKIIAVSLNPTDWKHVAFLSPPGVIVGCDYAGVVEKVGADVKHVSIGDKIGGLIHGARYEHTGSFAEYATSIADATWKKPENLSFEETAPYGVGCLTAVAALYQKLGLPTPAKPAESPFPLLVWGGSTSVGQYAVQLGKLSGLTVITTASPKNHELLKSLGADHVFDYRDPDVVAKIKAATHNSLAYGLDCISEGESQTKSTEAIGDKGGKIVTLLSTPQGLRKDVQWLHELLYTAIGRAFEMRGHKFEAVPQDREFIKSFIHNELNDLIAQGKVKPNVLKKMHGGLAGIPEGMDYIKAGKVSAEKLVYRIQDE